jgi:endonuclease-3
MPVTRTRTAKRPFNIPVMLGRIREAVKPYPKAALFELADDGFDSPFEILIACIISIRTLDETTVPCARRLFRAARTPAEVARLTAAAIDRLIHPCTFHESKARQILQIAERTVDEFGGELPCGFDTLTSFRGVGPKCANLTLGIACGESARGANGSPAEVGIGVDIHVHRVTNRWGYVHTRTPEQTMEALHETLPREHRVQINALLVPFGKHICTRVRPHCSTCPVLEYCQQVGVENPR